MKSGNKDMGKNDDALFAELLQDIDNISAPHTVDVCDKVMQQIASKPFLVPSHEKKRHTGIKIISSMAAACFAAAVILTFSISRNNLQASTSRDDMALSIIEIYDHCFYYDDEESTEDVSYNDNPMCLFI